MLRATVTETPSQQSWVLQGRLCKRWAAELKEKWESTRSTRRGKTCSVDVEDVTYVDAEGEALLLEIVHEGAKLRASRVYMKGVLELLKSQAL